MYDRPRNAGGMLVLQPLGKRLEAYTLMRPQEVLLVRADIAGEIDEVMIYRGFSSSLVRPTDSDPDVPVLPESATVVRVDRLASPYSPDNPQYLQRGLDRAELETLLREAGA